MTDRSPTSLDVAELEELDQYLRANAGEDDLLLDGVHGLMTALAIGPLPPKPEEWLPEILHQPFRDEQEAQRILSLLAHLNDTIGPELETGSYEPILGELEPDPQNNGSDVEYSARGWSEGFSRGIDLRAPAWETRLGQDMELMELLSPVIALAIDDGVFVSDAEFDSLSDEEYEECMARIPSAVVGVSRYWRHHPPTEEELQAALEAHQEGPVPRRRGGRTLH